MLEVNIRRGFPTNDLKTFSNPDILASYFRECAEAAFDLHEKAGKPEGMFTFLIQFEPTELVEE